MALIDSTIIIADDLTGANDTALQFFSKGSRTKIVIDYNEDFSCEDNVDVWAVSTESRNVDKETAVENVLNISNKIKESLGIDNIYKKIDSTLRGNVGVELVAMLEVSQKDAVIVVPSYIEEGRTTIGGYQLIHGTLIERSQCALDPKAPIYESYIPDIIKKDLNPQFDSLIDCIGLKTVTKGAGPIASKLNELIQNGKKIIVIDAVSTVDLEQIALALSKVNYNILPSGSAGLANAINKANNNNEICFKHIDSVPNLPRLVISGSATQLCSKQIEKLKEEKNNIHFIDLTIKDIILGVSCELIDEAVQKLKQGVDVVIHSSCIRKEMLDEELASQLIDEGITQEEFPTKISDFLSDLLFEINLLSNSIIVLVGGETSYKCVSKINSSYLEIIDIVQEAIPLCVDSNGKIIITKSGNFGTANTLVDIFNYFDRLKK